MGSMMDMGLKHGLGGAGIEDSIGRVLDMVLECIGFIQGMCMLVSGLMDRAMGVGYILVRMVADMLVNLSGVLSMDLVTIISGMGTHMLENTLQIKCMGLEYISLPMDIGMKELGMRVEGKGLECTHLEMEKPKQATGIMGYLMSQAHKTRPVPYLLLLLIIPKF